MTVSSARASAGARGPAADGSAAEGSAAGSPAATVAAPGYRHRFDARWNDNDVYGHLNNAVYNQAMDTVINTWLVEEAGFDLMLGDPLALCVSSSCQFRASASFPDSLIVELKVAKVGTSSVVWKPLITRASDEKLLVEGEFVSVYVDRETRRPVSVPESIRNALAATFTITAT